MQIFLILGPLFLIALALYLATRRSARARRKAPKLDHATRQERGVWGWARVQASSRTGSPGLGGLQRFELQLEVHLPGNPAYTASTTWLVEQESAGYVAEGKEVPVKVDPADLLFVYPQGSWARIAG